MAKVILICGTIASGKTYYAKELIKKKQAVRLSVDDLAIALFTTDAGDKHEAITKLIKAYLFAQSLEILETGLDVILDWGFWTKDGRDEARSFYERHGVKTELHVLDTDKETLVDRLKKRNKKIQDEAYNFYYFDDQLAKAFWSRFEKPNEDEADVWIRTRI